MCTCVYCNISEPCIRQSDIGPNFRMRPPHRHKRRRRLHSHQLVCLRSEFQISVWWHPSTCKDVPLSHAPCFASDSPLLYGCERSEYKQCDDLRVLSANLCTGLRVSNLQYTFKHDSIERSHGSLINLSENKSRNLVATHEISLR